MTDLLSIADLPEGGFAEILDLSERADPGKPLAGKGVALVFEKPSTRTVSDDGRIGFMGHDRKGAETTTRILKRWRAATSTIRFCALLVAEHLRLGFMVHDRPLDRRDGYRYLRATEPHTHASVVVSLSDRFATRGVRARQSFVRAHDRLE